MENLKVSNLYLKNPEKYSLKKIRRGLTYAILPIVLATTMTGCSNNFFKKKFPKVLGSTNASVVEDSVALEDVLESKISIDGNVEIHENFDLIENKISSMNISLSQEDFDSMKNYLNIIGSTYQYEDLYGIEEALNNEKEDKMEYTYDNVFRVYNLDEYVSIVKKNNTEYFSQQDGTRMAFITEMNEEDLRYTCELVLNSFYSLLDKYPQINKNEAFTTLSDLKIYNWTGFTIAAVTPDNSLKISQNMSDILQLMHEDIETYKSQIEHEIVHVIQKTPFETDDNEFARIGVSKKYESLDVNPLSWKWLVEASAEKIMNVNQNIEPLTYVNMINYLESLSLTTVIRSDVEVGQTEELCLTKDSEKIYEQMLCETDEDKKELIKLMYTMDVMQCEREDFFEVLKKEKGIELSEEEVKEFKYELKSSVCDTLNKYFYKNLTNVIYKEVVSLEDIFYLIKVYEADLNYHIEYDNGDKYIYNEEVMDRYLGIQNEFFELLAKSNNISSEKLSEYYDIYSSADVDSMSPKLDWLSEEKKDYITERINFFNDNNKFIASVKSCDLSVTSVKLGT